MTTALNMGAIDIPVSALLSTGPGVESLRNILINIRIPRVVLAAAVGAALAVVGASLQGLFRNPLADPGLLGVSGGAAVGAVSMIVLGSSITLPTSLAPYLLPIAAVIGAGLSTTILYLFAKRAGHFHTATLLLVGVGLNALFIAFIGLFQYVSDDVQLRTLTFWMMGSFGRSTWTTLLPVLFAITATLLVLIRQSRGMDLLQLGEPEAEYLGLNVGRLKHTIIIGSAVAVGCAVSLSGIVNFIGLVAPHLVRLLGGVLHRFVLLGSALLGAILAVMGDLLARTLVVPAEIPVGLVISVVGAPVFLWLLLRLRTP
ncbi:MAG: iron ABC transporter permease [Pseudomonadota bacterium]